MLNQIIDFFAQIPPEQRTMILVAGLVFFWVLEGIIPLANFKYKKGKHAALNLFFTFTTAVINFGFAFLIVKTSDAAVNGGWGLLGWTDMPIWADILIGLALMDLVGAYLVHWVEHRVHWMWKFHIIHHSDTKVDASTALRHHPGESVFRALFTLLAVALTGAPMWLVMMYQSSSAFLSQFNHSNTRLPAWIDKWLRWLIVTPSMHRVHHHAELPYTDVNFGNIFPWWDRIFGTYAHLDAAEIDYGLDVFDSRESHLGDLLKLPFDGKRYKTGEQ